MFRSALQGTIVRNEPAYRPRPVNMLGYHKFGNGTYDAFVKLSALEAIAWRAREAAPHEMIGYLVGRPFRDGKGTYAVVTEAIFAEFARSGPGTVETSLDDERGLLATLSADHPLAERLGWFHSHPFPMASYSPIDRDNQRSWSEPFQLGLLAYLDQNGNVGIVAFRGPESEAIHPQYTTSGSVLPNPGRTFRPIAEADHQETMPKAMQTIKRTIRRQTRLALLMLTVHVVCSASFLVRMGMIVQAMQEVRDHLAQPVILVKDKEATAGQLNNHAPVKATNLEAANVAAPTKSVEQSTQKQHEPDTEDW